MIFYICFNFADQVFLKPIYPASEEPIDGITSMRLAKDINNLHPNLVEVLEESESMFEHLDYLVDNENIIITLGAGAIGRRIREWVSRKNS